MSTPSSFSSSSLSARLLLTGPLVLTGEKDAAASASAAVLIAPSSAVRRRDVNSTSSSSTSSSIRSLSFTILPLPHASQYQHEHDSVIACQGSEGRNDAVLPWTLTYSVTESKLRWHIYGVEEEKNLLSTHLQEATSALVAAHSPLTSSSSYYALAAAATPVAPAASTFPLLPMSLTLSSSLSRTVDPFTITRISIDWNENEKEVSLRINDVKTASARYRLEENNCSSTRRSIISNTPLYLGHHQKPHVRTTQFMGLIADVALCEAISSVASTLACSISSFMPSYLWTSPPRIPPATRAEPIYSLRHLLAQPHHNIMLHSIPPSLAFPLPRSPRLNGSSKRKVIHCHDMLGGYTQQDRDTQHGWSDGSEQAYHAYAFQYWRYIDIFIYFTHARISIPPSCWIQAAHKNGVAILANLCTEWLDGEMENVRLVDGVIWDCDAAGENSNKPSWQLYADRLVALAVQHNFDGWFLNIEAKMPIDEEMLSQEEYKSGGASTDPASPASSPPPFRPSYMHKLLRFLRYLRSALHTARPGSLLIWYDSIKLSDGSLCWQSVLNEENYDIFETVDAIFTDYHWNKEMPEQSAALAAKTLRQHDVFTGVDLYGRGSYGGGGHSIHTALEIIHDSQTSLALFAPAWTYEGDGGTRSKMEQRQAFLDTEAKLWIGREEKRLWHDVDSFKSSFPSSSNIEENMLGWNVTHNGGDGWQIGKREDEERKNGDKRKQYCFITSHKLCQREQMIDLVSTVGRGGDDSAAITLTQSFLSSHQPDILITTEYAGTPPNIADSYQLCIRLLTEDHTELARYELPSVTCTSSAFTTIRHTFSNYGRGARYLHWMDGGHDVEKWAGSYGVRIGVSEVKVDVAELARQQKELQSHSSTKPRCIASYVDRAYMPLYEGKHTFNTGNGKHMFVAGKKMPLRSDNKGENYAEFRPWFNLAMQDCQTILVDGLLSDGILQPYKDSKQHNSVLSSSSSSSTLHGTAYITHDIAYDGGSCYEVEVETRSGLDERLSQMLQFECFEFGPPPATSEMQTATTKPLTSSSSSSVITPEALPSLIRRCLLPATVDSTTLDSLTSLIQEESDFLRAAPGCMTRTQLLHILVLKLGETLKECNAAKTQRKANKMCAAIVDAMVKEEMIELTEGDDETSPTSTTAASASSAPSSPTSSPLSHRPPPISQPPHGYNIQYVYSRPSKNWSVELLFEFQDQSQSIIHDMIGFDDETSESENSNITPNTVNSVSVASSSSVTPSQHPPPPQWRTVRGVLPAEAFADGRYVTRMFVLIRMHPCQRSASGPVVREERHKIRLGQVCVNRIIESSDADNATTSSASHSLNHPSSASSIHVTRYLCMDTFTKDSNAASFLFDWGEEGKDHEKIVSASSTSSLGLALSSSSVSASSGSSHSPSSWDVYLNYEWRARVHVPHYFTEAMIPDQADGFAVSVRNTSRISPTPSMSLFIPWSA